LPDIAPPKLTFLPPGILNILKFLFSKYLKIVNKLAPASILIDLFILLIFFYFINFF